MVNPAPKSQAQHAMLSEALEAAIQHHRAGRLAEAETLYRRILEAEPRLADALYLLGRVELERREFTAALKHLQQAVALMPSDASYHSHLGDALQGVEQPIQAISSYRAAVRLQPDYALAHHKLAQSLLAAGDPQAAEAAFREALRRHPEFPEALNNLGVLLRKLGRREEVCGLLEQASQLRPDFAEAHYNLGNVRRDLARVEAAVDAYRRAVALRPGFAEAHFGLGNALTQLGRRSEALTAFEQAVASDPHDVEAITNLAVAYNEQGHVDQAIDFCRRAIELAPDQALPHNNLASYLLASGQIEQAIEHIRQAVSLAPADAGLHSNLVHALNHAPGLDTTTVFTEHANWGRRHADALPAVADFRARDRTPERRLRIGYLSPYFRDHAITVFVEGILASHDHVTCEIICYSDVAQGDEATRRLHACADGWVETERFTHRQLAERIAKDQVDIAVDLTGHLSGNRLLALAHRPAPIQATYIGYQNTTGMAAMDYRITDAFADPPGMTESLHTEQLVRLPRAFFCYRPLPESPQVNRLPALERRQITFGAFNKFAKVNSDVLATWAQVLSRVPNSRLLVLAPPTASIAQRIHEAFAQHGVLADRAQFVPPRPRIDYLRLHHEVDIALDAFPFNGHTTTCEALWMGVPVVMMAGDAYVSRFGGSALAVLGLDNCIAHNREEYVFAASKLAGDLERLAELRKGLRGRMSNSALCDAVGFTRNLEAAYRQMWNNYCSRVT